MDPRGPALSSLLSTRGPMLVSPRVAPLPISPSSPLAAVSLDATFRTFSNTSSMRTAAVSSPTLADLLVRPEERKLQHTSSHLRLQLQWSSAYKMQLLVVRNAAVCCVCAAVANGAFYIGNVFAFKSSVDQSLHEFVMATLLWMGLSYAVVLTVAHVPSLTTQRFLECPDTRPGFWFCVKKLLSKSWVSLVATLTGMGAVGLIVQNTSLMTEHFRYRVHFYLAVACNLTFTAGLMLAVRRTYYEETHQGRSRRCALNNLSEPRSPVTSTARNAHQTPKPTPNPKPHRPPRYRTPSFWRESLNQLPNAVLIVLAGGYVHAVLTLWQTIQNRFSVMGFTVFGVVLKLALQEAARHYVLKKRIRSVRTMCVLVGVPTVLIDTQSRIVLLGTTNSFLMTGTFGMAMAEVILRATKAALVVWATRRRSRVLEGKLQQITLLRSRRNTGAATGRVSSFLPSPASVKLEYELWKKQMLSYHTAELTADMYAEYIAIGCSQSIVFWWFGHPLYPTLQRAIMSEIDVARWRFDQVVMLGLQSLVEVFVDYVCVVMEMAAGIEFDRIENLSTFLGALFMTVAVVNINISSAVYLG